MFDQIFVQREYSCLDDIVDPHLIIDCGANVGFSAAYFLSKFPRSYVIAIEPDDGNFAILEKNLQPYRRRVQLMKNAVWSHPTNLIMSSDKWGDGREWARQVREVRPGETGDIKAIDIGTLLDRSGFDVISILKIDVERAEAEIFSGSHEKWLSRVNVIAIELHDEECTRIFYDAIRCFPFDISRSGELTICRKKDIR